MERDVDEGLVGGERGRELLQLEQVVLAPERELDGRAHRAGLPRHDDGGERARRGQFVEVDVAQQRVRRRHRDDGRAGGVGERMPAPALRQRVIEIDAARRLRAQRRLRAGADGRRARLALRRRRREAARDAAVRLERRPQVIGREQVPRLVALHDGALGQNVAEPFAPLAAVGRARTGQAVGGAAVEQRERHARGRLAGEAQLAGVHLQHHPFASRRQRAHQQVRGRIDRPATDQVGAPDRAMLPVAGEAPLQHQRLRRVVGVEADPDEQLLVDVDRERRGQGVEQVLVHARQQVAAMAAARRRLAPGRQALGLERERIVLVRRDAGRLAVERVRQHRGAEAQPLAQAQRARAREQVVVQRGLEQRIDHLGLQQPRFP